jgi:large subunit ribosomal protein L14
MVCAGSYLKVADNSGGKLAKCIGVFRKKFATPGDFVVVSIRSVVSSLKVSKGEVHYGVIVRSRKAQVRKCGSWVRFDDNAVVLVNKKGEPIGSRVLGPVAREVRERGYKKIVSLSMITI